MIWSTENVERERGGGVEGGSRERERVFIELRKPRPLLALTFRAPFSHVLSVFDLWEFPLFFSSFLGASTKGLKSYAVFVLEVK